MLLIDLWILQARMVQNGIRNNLVDLLSILMDLSHRRPDHFILVHIIPKHFIYADFKNGLEIRIDGLVQDASEPKLVDVKTGCVAIVKDLRVTKAMNRRTVRTTMCQ